MGNNFLSVAEVAEHFRVSKMTVYRLMECGELTFTRVGRGYRIPVREVERFTDTNTNRRQPAEAAS